MLTAMATITGALHGINSVKKVSYTDVMMPALEDMRIPQSVA
jgi:hypothetical protein